MGIDEQLPFLIGLQELDLEIERLTEEHELIPIKINELKNELNEETKKLEDFKNKIIDLEKIRKTKEMDLQTAEQNIAKHTKELYSVKSNVEYKALLSEIEKEKSTKSALEDEILGILEEIEESKKSLSDLTKKFQEKKQSIDKEILNLEETMKELERLIETKKEQRSVFTKNISKNIIEKYDKIRAKKDGIAIAKIDEENEFCTICNMKLSKQTINEVALGRDLVYCDECSRILYLESRLSLVNIDVGKSEEVASHSSGEESPDSTQLRDSTG